MITIQAFFFFKFDHLKKIIKDKLPTCLFFNNYPYNKEHNKLKCIFIHIPKNAGTSVLKTLSSKTKIGTGRVHERYSVYQKTSPSKFTSYEKFCIVRNPWDRLLSAYFYLFNGGNKKCDSPFCHLFKTEAPTFEVFVKKWLDIYKIYGITVLQPQLFYIYDFQNKKFMVDSILQFENLNDDFQTFKKKIGITKKLPRLNKSKHNNYIEYYDDEMINIVGQFYKYDIDLLKYTFK
ncbi:MAG: sulfotransferase family 2 domain-containing protein [Pseudomonadota bacterium]